MPNDFKVDKLNQFRNDDGKLVDIGLGCYAQIYVCNNGDTLCADCAEQAILQTEEQGYTIGDEPVNAFSSADCESHIECTNCNRTLSEEPEQ
jgi:hypothetical protein